LLQKYRRSEELGRIEYASSVPLFHSMGAAVLVGAPVLIGYSFFSFLFQLLLFRFIHFLLVWCCCVNSVVRADLVYQAVCCEKIQYRNILKHDILICGRCCHSHHIPISIVAMEFLSSRHCLCHDDIIFSSSFSCVKVVATLEDGETTVMLIISVGVRHDHFIYHPHRCLIMQP